MSVKEEEDHKFQNTLPVYIIFTGKSIIIFEMMIKTCESHFCLVYSKNLLNPFSATVVSTSFNQFSLHAKIGYNSFQQSVYRSGSTS